MSQIQRLRNSQMNKQSSPQRWPNRLPKLRGAAPILVFGLVALYQWVLPGVTEAYRLWATIALYGISGSVVVWVGLTWLGQQTARHAQTENDLQTARQNLADTRQQLLTVHNIGREIASATDTQRVLELAARAPSQLAGAVGATVITIDNEQGRFKLDMAWGLSDAYLHRLQQRMEQGIPSDRCVNCKLLTGRVDSGCLMFGGLDKLAKQEGIQSLICLPLTRNNRCEGFINAYFSSSDGPPAEQVQLLNIIATEIAAALDSVRLRANQKATLYIIERLTETRQGLDELLQQALNIALKGWGVDHGAILLYDEAKGTWHHWTQKGLDDAPQPLQSGPIQNSRYREMALYLAKKVQKSQRPLLIPDLSQYPVDHNGLQSAAVAPLVTGQELIGVLLMATPHPNFFQPRQNPFFTAIAHQAALAVSNAKLHTQVQEMAILEERYRLSREIHDGLAQTLSFLGWHFDHLKTLLDKQKYNQLTGQLEHGQQMVREAYMDVREAIDGLRLEGQPSGDRLIADLEQYAADFQNRTGIEVTVEAPPLPDGLPPATELQLLRIAQEALTNVRKHANATQVWIRLQHQANHRLTLTIADNGSGFNPANPQSRGHIGMSTMRERAQSQHGELAIVTAPRQGTQISVTIPLKDDQ